MKTYTKEEARSVIQNRTYQIYNDCNDLELLTYLFSFRDKQLDFSILPNNVINDYSYFNFKSDYSLNFRKYVQPALGLIKLSQIIDEQAEIINEQLKPKKMTFKYSDLQFKKDDITWRNYKWFDKTIELRFKPDYSKEIEALEKKAAEYGEKVIINFESI